MFSLLQSWLSSRSVERSIRKIPDEKSIFKIAFLSFHFVVLYFELAGKNQ